MAEPVSVVLLEERIVDLFFYCWWCTDECNLTSDVMHFRIIYFQNQLVSFQLVIQELVIKAFSFWFLT